MKRREFLTSTAMASAALTMGIPVLGSCSGVKKETDGITLKSREELGLPESLEKAPDGKPLKFGLIGCGGRGKGAATNLLDAGNGLQIVALAELLPDRLQEGLKLLRDKRQQPITDDHAFLGFDAYQKVLAMDIDAVIIAVPSRFHPKLFKAAIEAGKHVFIEKPCGVDPVGIRSFMVTARLADQKKLCVVCGTQRRHAPEYIETYRRVASGMIGEIVGGACYWNTARTWYRKRKPGWTDTEYILRNWLNYPFMGGDVITDHHIHNLDVISWFLGNKAPVRALGQGAKVRPSLGNKYDFFMVDYEFENNVHILSSTRHIDGCSNKIGEVVHGTKGSTDCCGTIWDNEGNEIWKYDGRKAAHYVQEHIDWVTAIRTGKHINNAHDMSRSTMIAVMGRDSAYTGKTITWDEIMASQSVLGPDITAMGKLDYSDEHPLPGISSVKRIEKDQ